MIGRRERRAERVVRAVARDAAAAVIFVTTLDQKISSEGGCSLQEAIFSANFDSNVAISHYQGTTPVLVTTLCVAGSGDDILVYANGTSTFLGGAGFDTLRVDDAVAGQVDLRSTAIGDAQIDSIDAIALGGGNNVTLRLDYQSVLDFEATGDTLRITGEAGDTLNLHEAIAPSGTDAWVMTGSANGVETWQYAASGGGTPIATLLVDQAITVQ